MTVLFTVQEDKAYRTKNSQKFAERMKKRKCIKLSFKFLTENTLWFELFGIKKKIPFNFSSFL